MVVDMIWYCKIVTVLTCISMDKADACVSVWCEFSSKTSNPVWNLMVK